MNQSSYHVLKEDDGWQRLAAAQHLLNQLADYFLMLTGALSSQCSYIK
jgi:hypothetical protein